MNHLVKQDFIERAKDINRFHVQQLKDEQNWTIQKTANALNRSLGSVSQDLLVAQWCKTHERQLKTCASLRDALKWIKSKQREMRLITGD